MYHMRLGTHCTVVVTGHAVHGVHSVASLVLHAKRGIRCVGKAICSMAKKTLSGNCASRSCAVMKLSLPPLLFAPWLFVSCSHADARVLVTACAHDNACSRTHCFFRALSRPPSQCPVKRMCRARGAAETGECLCCVFHYTILYIPSV